MVEVEVKLALPDADAYAMVLEALAPHKRTLLQQRNNFFDTPGGDIKKSGHTLRVRIINDKQAVLSVKGRLETKDGISRATEVEDHVDPELAERALNNPQELLSCGNPILEGLRKDVPLKDLVCLGTFQNNRTVFDWENYVLEVDQTIYPPTASHPTEATFYEIELETSEPEKAKVLLVKFLNDHKIPHKDNDTTKFKRFRKRAKAAAADTSSPSY